MNSSFDTYVEDTSAIIACLKDENETLQSENESLIAKRSELERELLHMNDVLNALAKKFVAEDHPLTKVD
jgi:chaperonin cofactor prefoldin